MSKHYGKWDTILTGRYTIRTTMKWGFDE